MLPVLLSAGPRIALALGAGARGARLVSLATNLAPLVQEIWSLVRPGMPLSAQAASTLNDLEVLGPITSALTNLSGQYMKYAAQQNQAAVTTREFKSRERAANEARWAAQMQARRERLRTESEARVAEAVRSAQDLALAFYPIDGGGTGPYGAETEIFGYTSFDKKNQTAQRIQRMRTRNKALKNENQQLNEQLQANAQQYAENMANAQQAYQAGANQVANLVPSLATASPADVIQYQPGGGFGWEGGGGVPGDAYYYGSSIDSPDQFYPAWDPDDPSQLFDLIEELSPELLYDVAEASDLVRGGADVVVSSDDHKADPASCRYYGYREDPQFKKTGVFYRSNLVEARLVPDLGEGVYGQIDMVGLPRPIAISVRSGPARARISLGHELAHLMNADLKLGRSHDTVHAIGHMLATEAYPAMQALDEFARRP
jgi:hypothetical protein